VVWKNNSIINQVIHKVTLKPETNTYLENELLALFWIQRSSPTCSIFQLDPTFIPESFLLESFPLSELELLSFPESALSLLPLSLPLLELPLAGTSDWAPLSSRALSLACKSTMIPERVETVSVRSLTRRS